MSSFIPYHPPIASIHFLPKKYHVFLSFRGRDVRTTLVDHLFESLSTAGIHVFLDSEKLEKGKDIGLSLEKAIEDTDIHIPIFSKSYADSVWCLKEATQMLKSEGLIVPLFYNVDPSDVRWPEKGQYAEAFKKHYSHMDRHGEATIAEWREALNQISSLVGWSLETTSGYEGKLVKRVVWDVIKTLNNVPLDVAKHAVGLDEVKSKLIEKLKMKINDRGVTVGIWGMGGVGKTTLAKAVYNELNHSFGAASFLFDVRTNAQQINGLRDLQRQLMKDLLKNDVEVPSVDHGKSLMRERLGSARVLVILDDVDHTNQLDALAGDWFAPGSRVIITTRDKHVLNVGQIDEIHQMAGLKEDKALELFSWHAFLRACPDKEYVDLSTSIVKFCCGLPLSLEVLGAYLYDKKDIRCWNEMFLMPHSITSIEDIFKTLKISYDSLSYWEKQIFLDIACFFIGLEGRDREDAMIFWECLKWNAYTAIENLSLKLLVRISNEGGGFEMHDHLRDLGRAIVKEEWPEDPGKCSRLWTTDDARQIIDEGLITKHVRYLLYKPQTKDKRIVWPMNQSEPMRNLCYVCLHNAKIEGDISKFAPNLVWLRLEECSFSSLQMWNMKKLAILDVRYEWGRRHFSKGEWRSECTNSPRNFWNENFQMPTKLRVLRFEGCKGLTNLDELSNHTSLLKLELAYCYSLRSLHDSIELLQELRHLVLSSCSVLQRIPDSMGKLLQLQDLKLSSCPSVQIVPDSIGNLLQLKDLELSSCSGLERVPDSIGNLRHLKTLNLSWCSKLQVIPDSIGYLLQLKDINLSRCESLQKLPGTFGNLLHLNHVNLSRCSRLERIPDSIGNLHQLAGLNLSRCSSLQSLPNSIGSLRQLLVLDLSGCSSLHTLPDSIENLQQLEVLNLARCSSLQRIPDSIGKLLRLDKLYLTDCISLESIPNSIGNLLQLTFLEWSNCRNLKTMPDSIRLLPQLVLDPKQHL